MDWEARLGPTVLNSDKFQVELGILLLFSFISLYQNATVSVNLKGSEAKVYTRYFWITLNNSHPFFLWHSPCFLTRRKTKGAPMDSRQSDTITYSSVFNINEIRKEAQKSLSEGAVTVDYPLDVKQACRILNEALASEILCVLRYRHHQIIAKGINYPQVAAEFKEHAENEEKHMIELAERIDQLGGDPDMNPATITARSATEYGTSGDLVTMIREDLVAERIAIEVYRQMIEWFSADTTTRRMLERILADEEEHATDLADLLVTVGQQSSSIMSGDKEQH